MNSEQVNSCVVYRSYLDAILELKNDAERWQMMKIILEYALDGKKPDMSKLKANQRLIFLMAQPTIESNRQNRINGQRGGRPPKRRINGGPSQKSKNITYPTLYVAPDELKRLQMQDALNQLRGNVTD